MQITLNRDNAITTSPFGKKIRPFTDTDANGKDIVIGKGRSQPDLARLLYGISTVTPVSANFPFLDRHNKERTYDPGKEDPFVFKSHASIGEFHRDARKLIDFLVTEWKELNLPTKTDKDRGIVLPDTDKIWEHLDTGSDIDKVIHAHRSEVAFILSNVDILKKANIVRDVIPGWWTASYAGKDAPDVAHFGPSLRCHIKASKILRSSREFAKKRAELAQSIGDPLDTNVGYPLFSAQMDDKGNPIARIKTVKIFQGMGTAGYDAMKLLQEIDKRAGVYGLSGFPFTVAPISRYQYGYKWAHVFYRSSTGLMTDYDERGPSTTRIAWMVPYIFNLLLSPLQAEWKAMRMLMPGLFHDGNARKNRLAVARRENYWIAEADYSNYDRFMPINLFLAFVKGFLEGVPHADYWLNMCWIMHHKLPLIWPDYIGEDKGRGWVFYPKKLGLLSGVKITSEEGTFINSIVNGQSLIDAGVLTEKQYLEYLVQYKNGNVGAGQEYYQIQSDDTLIQHKDLKTMKKIADAFVANTARAGLKGELMLGDRFLMRHMSDGRDTPVPSRIWQNTLQNEAPYDDPLKFLVGLAMRSDGILGQKTVDPFATGLRQNTTMIEVKFTLFVMESINGFLTTARSPQRTAIEFVNTVIEIARRMVAQGKSKVMMSVEDASRLDKMRKAYLAELAKRELEALSQGIALNSNAAQTLLYELHKNQNIPSQSMLLDQITRLDSSLKSVLDSVQNKENTFYKTAMNTIRIPLNL